MPTKKKTDTEINTEDVNTGDAVEVNSSNDGVSVEDVDSGDETDVDTDVDTEVDTGDDTVNVDTGDEVNVKAWTYVEVAVQLGSREHVRFRREFAGGEDTSPLEILDHLTDAMKSYLESD